jgi:hypothetical protein
MSNHNGELELELEEEFHEGESHGEIHEGEGWLGAIGNVVGSLLGEEESEDESEDEIAQEYAHEFGHEFAHEHLGESEDEIHGEHGEIHEGEGWLGAIGNVVGNLLGEEEGEDEFEDEMETEEFFGKIGKFLKKAAPMLKKVAKAAAPIVGGALLGPVGSSLGSLATSSLEGESEDEFEGELEDEAEGEQEMVHEIASHELTNNEAIAELLAESASQEQHESAAEAMAGAAALSIISAADRRALRIHLPHLVRAVAILTRILRKRRITRPAVRVVPNIVRLAVKDLKRKSAKGVPTTRRSVAKAVAKRVKKVLGSPKACAAAVARNVKVSRAYKRPRRTHRRRRPVRG